MALVRQGTLNGKGPMLWEGDVHREEVHGPGAGERQGLRNVRK